MDEFLADLIRLINKHGIDNLFSVPDFILGEYIVENLEAFERLQNKYDKYYNSEGDEMDGDHQSALASAGYGTDEDYGGADERI